VYVCHNWAITFSDGNNNDSDVQEIQGGSDNDTNDTDREEEKQESDASEILESGDEM